MRKVIPDDELREGLAECPDELLLVVAYNSLRIAMEQRFDSSKREVNRSACIIARACVGRLLELPEFPDPELCKAAQRRYLDEFKSSNAPV